MGFKDNPKKDDRENLRLAAGKNVALAYVDQGYTGEKPAAAAQEQGLRLEVVKHHEAKPAFLCRLQRLRQVCDLRTALTACKINPDCIVPLGVIHYFNHYTTFACERKDHPYCLPATRTAG